MKAVTTLIAAAALVAGISVANAQSSMSKGSMGSSSSMQKNATGSGKFCLQPSGSSSTMNCKYQTMASCQQAAKSAKGSCVANPNASTTGSK
ncbi:MAG TPA: hypothetical protein VFX37_04020 [Pseudolabrys sp.]|nr:hypothetical protein [Pseudolabrys sp.]